MAETKSYIKIANDILQSGNIASLREEIAKTLSGVKSYRTAINERLKGFEEKKKQEELALKEAQVNAQALPETVTETPENKVVEPKEKVEKVE
ncbi:MAG: hypothetical protein IJ330_04015, partial [Oscillospiraceae bacterium]|nr:hypothetical protein [Oscillospiraceae bacterium]